MVFTYDRRAEVEEEDIGELDVADYLVFLFALDTYMRWVEETRNVPVDQIPEGDLDTVTKRGLALLRMADYRTFNLLEQELRSALTNKGSLQMLNQVMRTPPSVRGVGIRALRLRTILSRSGTATVKAVFGKSVRARKEVLDAVEAAMLEDADAALSKFAAITLRNKRLEAWIDLASNTAVPLVPVVTNPIQEAAKAVTDTAMQARVHAVQEAGAAPASDKANEAGVQQQLALDEVERQAKEAAVKSLQHGGGEDALVTRSEAIAIATTAVATAATNADDLRNVPPAFINQGFPLDPEQQAAAVTDGRVLVAAGAGSGKTTTLVSRIAYLVQERGVLPSRILACSFNRKAANELRAKVQEKIGKAMLDQMSIGTMHSLFLRFILGDSRTGIPAFGTPEERALFQPQRLIADSEPGKPPKPGPRPINMTKTIQGIFKECQETLPGLTGYPPEWFKDIPKAKKCNLYVNGWKGNDVSVAEAKALARTKVEKIAALWYEMYMGLKGDLPGWKPPCDSKSVDGWKNQFRPGGERLGDLDDQLRVFRDILVRNPDARRRIQGMFDHIMVDEAQDRNKIQAQIFELMGEHVGDGSDGRSLWIVGDDKQCVAVDTPVSVPGGVVRAGDLKAGDLVLAYCNGDVVPQQVRHVVPQTWTWGYKITTESGKSLTMSPNHKIWVSDPGDPGYLVYLMYRRDRGFRVGFTNNNTLEYGFSYGQQPQAEKAERLWVLGVCADGDAAAVQEMYYSLHYRVPTQPFRCDWISKRKIDAVFGEFGHNGWRILEARNLSFDYPNWMCRNSATNVVRTVTLTAHSPKGTQVSTEWAVGEVGESVDAAEIWQGRAYVCKWFPKYREALAFAEELAHKLNYNLCHKLFVNTEVSLAKTTASAVFPGMSVAVLYNGQLMLDKVVAVDQVEASFVDLDVNDASNFFGDSILSSNSIYQFRGAHPEIFSELDGAAGWTTRMIRTNYRCEPEIVEAANRLAAHNTNQIPMESRADPKKPRGRASIQVHLPSNYAEGAISTISRIVRETQEPPLGQGTSYSEYAVLTRTNAELNDFETACVLAEVPYARTGGHGLFDSPESRAVLGYVDLAYGTDFERMASSLAAALTKPERGLYLSADRVAQITRETIEDVARMQGLDVRSVDPVGLVTQTRFARQLATNLKMPYRQKMQDFAFRKAVDALTYNLLEMGRQIIAIRRMTQEEGMSAGDVLNFILDSVTSTVVSWDREERREVTTTRSLRDQISEDLAVFSDEEGDEQEEESATSELMTTPEGNLVPVKKDNPAKGLGAVQFLFLMSEPNRRDGEEGTDPTTAGGFIKKLARIRANADKLRVDLQKWAKENAAKPPEQREEHPNCVILSTIHCSPPDEPVLTLDGWVPIAELDPSRHALASYTRSSNQLLWGEPPSDNAARSSGYSFVKDSRPYSGLIVTLTTERSRTRVTREHRVLARFAESFLDKHVVYLMRRGEWWHVGTCMSAHRSYHGAGVGAQMGTELADAGWILGVYNTKEEAVAEELRIQATYGIPGFTFEAAEGGMLTSAQLHTIHENVKAVVAPRVHALLQDFGLDVHCPLYVQGKENDFQKAFMLHASNVLDGYMEIPVASDAFVKRKGTEADRIEPEWLPVTVVREHYEGPVYSITVLPHHFYVSGGAVVHNSVKGAEWRDTTVVMAPGVFPRDHRIAPGEEPPTEEELQAEMVAERNLAYVALTRARQNLTVLCPPSSKYLGLSRFVIEAGLRPGENVAKPEGVPTSEPEPKTASLSTGPDYDFFTSIEYDYAR